jgi:hypothetical protein
MKTLIKTNNSLILVSDEESKTGYVLCPDNSINKLVGFDPDIMKHYVIINGAKCFVNKEGFKKVLSQSPKISKEVADEIGWIDVEELANIKYPISNRMIIDQESNYYIGKEQDAFIEGYRQKAQELNQKKYSNEEVLILMDSAVKNVGFGDTNKTDKYKSIIKSLSQPQQYSVEAEEIDEVWNVTKIIKNN